MELTQELYLQVHNATGPYNASVLAAFAPAPWLLPKGSVLPYTGLHDNLDRLLEVQAAVYAGYRSVSLIFFNYHQSLLLMNCLYSMSKFASERAQRTTASQHEGAVEAGGRQELVQGCRAARALARGRRADGSKGSAPAAARTGWLVRRREPLPPLFACPAHTPPRPAPPCPGVRNYIIVVWEEASLAVCRDMNLPCYNAAPMLPGPIDSTKEALFMSPDYLKIM